MVAATPKPSLYIETSVVSYLTAKASTDVIALAHQELTRRWWEQGRGEYELFASPVVIAEAGRGDPVAAERRFELLAGVELLEAGPQVERLAGDIHQGLRLPRKAAVDAAHMAFAVSCEMDYLLTWNCVHLANPHNLRMLADLTRQRGLWLPIICTPAEMVERRKEL